MQPLIEHIFIQIIYFYFTWRNLLWESKQTFFLRYTTQTAKSVDFEVVNSSGQFPGIVANSSEFWLIPLIFNVHNVVRNGRFRRIGKRNQPLQNCHFQPSQRQMQIQFLVRSLQEMTNAVFQLLQFFTFNLCFEKGQESHYIQPSNLSCLKLFQCINITLSGSNIVWWHVIRQPYNERTTERQSWLISGSRTHYRSQGVSIR